MKVKTYKYPLKIGFKDKSGRDENYITDANDEVVVGGWGDFGGIQNNAVARAIVKALNDKRPRIYIKK